MLKKKKEKKKKKIENRLDLVRSTTTHVRARCGSQEASHEATAVSVAAGLQLLGRLAGRFEGLLGFDVGDVDVAVVQREGSRAAGGIREHEVVGTVGGNRADGSRGAS